MIFGAITFDQFEVNPRERDFTVPREPKCRLDEDDPAGRVVSCDFIDRTGTSMNVGVANKRFGYVTADQH